MTETVCFVCCIFSRYFFWY